MTEPQAEEGLAKERTSLGDIDLTKLTGFLVPVFTCFRENEFKSLNIDPIDHYAKWVKQIGAKGVLVNSISGEGPTLGKDERQLHAEAWSAACRKWNLIMLLQVGGAPLPDVIEIARHASTLPIHGITCLPELFYKPNNVKQLIGYCKIIAKNCSNHPFLYYHMPKFTGLDLDMADFCQRAEVDIPNFVGLEWLHSDLAMAVKCIDSNRLILISDSRFLSSAMLLGFKTFCMAAFNIVPELMITIYSAIENGNIKKAKDGQKHLNLLLRDRTAKFKRANWVMGMKLWFNETMRNSSFSATISVGNARKLY